MTQKQTILNYLQNNPWVCGTRFQQAYIPEYRSRINELRKGGYRIAARRCATHKHNGPIQEWGLQGVPGSAIIRPSKPISETAKQFLKDFEVKEESKQLTMNV